MSKIKHKTNPIGVSFSKNLIEELRQDKLAETPQQVLNFLTAFYCRNKHYESNGKLIPEQIASTTPPRIKVETPKEVIVKEITPVQSDDLFERFMGIKIFRIEEFTKFPDKEKPIDKIKAVEWMLLKKVDDKKIRDQWNDFLKNKTN